MSSSALCENKCERPVHFVDLISSNHLLPYTAKERRYLSQALRALRAYDTLRLQSQPISFHGRNERCVGMTRTLKALQLLPARRISALAALRCCAARPCSYKGKLLRVSTNVLSVGR
eukprot:IDg3096t1